MPYGTANDTLPSRMERLLFRTEMLPLHTDPFVTSLSLQPTERLREDFICISYRSHISLERLCLDYLYYLIIESQY